MPTDAEWDMVELTCCSDEQLRERMLRNDLSVFLQNDYDVIRILRQNKWIVRSVLDAHDKAIGLDDIFRDGPSPL